MDDFRAGWLNKDVELDFGEFIGFLLSLVLVMIVFSSIAGYRYKGEPRTKRLFMRALLVSCLSSVVVGLVYILYYKSGDTLNFFRSGRHLAKVLLEDLESGWFFITLDNRDMNLDFISTQRAIRQFGLTDYYRDPLNYKMVLITIPFVYLGFFSYLGTAVIFGSVTFLGAWALYRAVGREYPATQTTLAYLVFFTPTLLAWGRGLFKDSLGLAAISFATYSVIMLKRSRYKNWLPLLITLVPLTLTLIVKEYIIFAFLPFLVFYLVLSARDNIKNKTVRLATTPILIAISLAAGYLVLDRVSAMSAKYNLEEVAGRAKTTYDDLTKDYYYKSGGGSRYDLGTYDASVAGIVPKIPVALSVTFIRPFPWEFGTNPLLFLSALEALGTLLFMLFILFKIGLIKLIQGIISSPMVLFCMGFALTFGFMVGLTSGNFGNLARYKIPCMPFFFIGLAVLYENIKQEKNAFLNERFQRRLQRMNSMLGLNEDGKDTTSHTSPDTPADDSPPLLGSFPSPSRQ